MHKFEDLIVDIRGPVAEIRINRPERLNALRMTITDREIIRAFDLLAGDEAVRAIVLTGAGERAFCTGWDMEAVAIVRGTRNLDAAKRIADWAATRRANELYSRFYAVTAFPGVTNTPQNYPVHAEERMFRNDFTWMAQNRERILAEWSRRYESKAAPRN